MTPPPPLQPQEFNHDSIHNFHTTTEPVEDNGPGNSDTFLSRVFGLHSIYNQLQDNYQYYDPEIDDALVYHHSESSHNDFPSLRAPEQSQNLEQLEADSGTNGKTGGSISPSNNLLDSESDLDLSSSESESDHAPVSATKIRKAPGLSPAVNNSTLNLYQHISPDVGDDQEDVGNLPPKNRTLKFTTPKKFLFNKDAKQSYLPLYNDPSNSNQNQQFRRPPQENNTSIQTIYQRQNKRNVVIPPRERALYLWANIINMDEFLIDLYYYYRGKGLLNIILSRVVSLVILVFILSFTVFLYWGIDYDFYLNDWKSNSHSTVITLSDLIIPHFLATRVPFSIKFLLFGFFCYIVLRLIQLYFDYKYKLKEIQNFYKQLIGISKDDELMTISWITIVERLMLLKDYNTLTSTNANLPPHYLNDLNSKIRLNAHDIANRIMRKENYMIALINKEVLDLSIPILNVSNPNLFLNNFNIFTTKSVLTKTLEWNLKLCINNFVFNNHGQIKGNILKEANRNHLAKELNSRFKMAAIINLILCPFIVIYFVLLYFFRYFNEYKSNPSSILGLRQYTPWAEWKLREFNELPHLFIKRLHLSIGPANTYINQFPGGFLVLNLTGLINFVSGAIMAVLVIMGLWFEDEDHSFWSFEITTNKSALFYISLFGTLWAITSSSNNSTSTTNTSENLNYQSSSFFYDPEASLRYVSQFTHYLPSSWNGRLHTVEVKSEFCELYSLKIIIIINEIISLILTPFILWFRVSNSAGAIIDFFRDYSVHVDGLGYVCYFAMFNFEEKDKNMMYDLNKRKKKSKRARKLRSNDQGDKSKQDTATNIELNQLKPQTSSDESSNSEDSNVDDYYQDDKMIKSYMYFLESYGGSQKNPRNGNKPANGSSKNRGDGLKPIGRSALNTGSNGNGLRPTTNNQTLRNKVNGTIVEGPSSSFIVPQSSNAGYLPNSQTSFGLTESAYNVNYKFNEMDEQGYDEDDGEDSLKKHRFSRRKQGVLGMINQFYKQDVGR